MDLKREAAFWAGRHYQENKSLLGNSTVFSSALGREVRKSAGQGTDAEKAEGDFLWAHEVSACIWKMKKIASCALRCLAELGAGQELRVTTQCHRRKKFIYLREIHGKTFRKAHDHLILQQPREALDSYHLYGTSYPFESAANRKEGNIPLRSLKQHRSHELLTHVVLTQR